MTTHEPTLRSADTSSLETAVQEPDSPAETGINGEIMNHDRIECDGGGADRREAMRRDGNRRNPNTRARRSSPSDHEGLMP